MALFIKLEAICITTHLPHGSVYYVVVLKAPCMCGVLKCYGPVACNLNICVYAPFILGAGISVDSLQHYRPCDVTCIESDDHSSIYTMFLLGIINAMMNLKQFGPLVVIYV